MAQAEACTTAKHVSHSGNGAPDEPFSKVPAAHVDNPPSEGGFPGTIIREGQFAEPTRRTLLGGASAAVAGALAVGTVLAGSVVALRAAQGASVTGLENNPVDQIFAAIDAHRSAFSAYIEAVHAEFDREEVEEPAADALYQELEEARDEACDRRCEAGSRLLEIRPRTIEGVIALCRYAQESYHTDDGQWPLSVEGYWNEARDVDDDNIWALTLFENIAAALREIGGVA